MYHMMAGLGGMLILMAGFVAIVSFIANTPKKEVGNAIAWLGFGGLVTLACSVLFV